MGKFELLEHTADVGVIATGDSLVEALAWAARGMFSVIVEPDTVALVSCLEVSVSSPDQEALAVDWLNELLYRYEAEGFLPGEFRVSVDETGNSLEAQCLGEPFDPERHHILTSVKAATYHELMVTHNHQWQIRVILDV